MIEVSRKVYIKHKPRAIRREGEQYSDQDSNQYVGSALTKGGDSLRGLDFDEEKIYLPSIIGVNPNKDGWETATKNYWANIRVRIPYGIGYELEIGFKYKTQADADLAEAADVYDYATRQKYGTPIVPADYILWRYCLVYGRVANNIADVGNAPKIKFYLYSKDAEVNDKHVALELKKKAFTKLISILGDREQVDHVLTLFNDPLAYAVKRDKEKDIALETYSVNEPQKFIDLTNDPALKMKALIERAITLGHLRRIENTDTIVYGDNTHIGNNMNDAVVYLNNPRNSRILTNIKAKMSYITPLTPPNTQVEPVPVDSGTSTGVEIQDMDMNDLVVEELTSPPTQIPTSATASTPVQPKTTGSKGIELKKPQ